MTGCLRRYLWIERDVSAEAFRVIVHKPLPRKRKKPGVLAPARSVADADASAERRAIASFYLVWKLRTGGICAVGSYTLIRMRAHPLVRLIVRAGGQWPGLDVDIDISYEDLSRHCTRSCTGVHSSISAAPGGLSLPRANEGIGLMFLVTTLSGSSAVQARSRRALLAVPGEICTVSGPIRRVSFVLIENVQKAGS
jgi:hypothetical protein